jgi:hypothetical protein
MDDQQTKNQFVFDHDEKYFPVVRTAGGEIKISANFSLAEQGIRSRERLARLIDFIQRNTRMPAHHSNGANSTCISHRLAAQVVYLAYWENYPPEFCIEERERTTVVLAHFPKQPALTVVLDMFKDGLDPHAEIQGWWNFFCETISAHIDIWHVALVIEQSVYRRLNVGHFPLVQVDILTNHISLENNVSQTATQEVVSDAKG